MVNKIRELVQGICELIVEAQIDATESHKEAMNSYGAGYDTGYVVGLKEVLRRLEDIQKSYGV